MQEDSEDQASLLARKTLHLRVFPEGTKPMHLSIKDVGGEILVVPQFTLAADLQKGNRPSFHLAKEPEGATHLFEFYVSRLEDEISVRKGVFGANMQVNLVNDGPVTILLSSA